MLHIRYVYTSSFLFLVFFFLSKGYTLSLVYLLLYVGVAFCDLFPLALPALLIPRSVLLTVRMGGTPGPLLHSIQAQAQATVSITFRFLAFTLGILKDLPTLYLHFLDIHVIRFSFFLVRMVTMLFIVVVNVHKYICLSSMSMRPFPYLTRRFLDS